MWTRFIASAFLVLALTAPAAAQDPSSLQIFRSVQRQVLTYSHFTVFDSVNAQIKDGVVTLTGKVLMPFKKDDLGERVGKVRGVKAVNNLIEVLPASKSDDELRVGIAKAIYGNSSLSRYATQVNPPIHIIVERGRVTLTGVVNSNVERMLARSLATGFGELAVVNELRTDAEVREAELRAMRSY